MRSFTLVLWFMGVVVLATGSALANTIWDPTASYSNVNNPDGAWSYGWMNNSQFQLFTSNGPDPGPLPGWYGPLNGLVPYQQELFPVVWLNTGSPVDGVQTGQLSLEPGPDGEAAIVRWTAPTGVGGLASIQGQFLPGDGGIMQVSIFENGNWTSPLWTGTDYGTFDLTTPLTAGDTIDFAAYGGFYSGNTPLQTTITVTPTPEPSAFALLGFGAIGLLGFAWRLRLRAKA